MSMAMAVQVRELRQEMTAAILLIRALSNEIDALKEEMKRLQAKRNERR